MAESGTTLYTADQADVARLALKELFSTPSGARGIWVYRGDIYVWRGDRWTLTDTGAFEKAVVDWLCHTKWLKPSQGGYEERLLSQTYKARDMKDVMWLIQATSAFPYTSTPRWLAPEEALPDPDHCIAFTDVIVDILGSAKGRRDGRGADYFVTLPRTENFFDACTLTVPFTPGVPCPIWLKCQKDSGLGNPMWTEARERLYGYGLMPTRKHNKIGLEYGKSRSGKGLGTNYVLSPIMGKPGYFGISLKDLADTHGLDGVHSSRILVVGECANLASTAGQNVASILKMAAGADERTINIKYVRQLKGVRLQCLPILQSNPIPTLPNDAGGISTKLVVIPFRNTFAGAEDVELPQKLQPELPAIAARLADAAVRLEMEDNHKLRFPILDEAAEALSEFEKETNPIDAFLRWGFVKNPTAWTDAELIRTLRAEFESITGISLYQRNSSRRLNDHHLLSELEHRSSWRVYRKARNHNRDLGLMGLAPKKMDDNPTG